MTNDTLSSSMLKVCTQCGQSRPHSEYHKKKDGKFGLQPKCKACVLAYQRARWQNDKEHMKEIDARSKEKHGRKYYERYKEKNNARKRTRYRTDEEYRERCKLYARKWGAEHYYRKAYVHKQWEKANQQRRKIYIKRHQNKYREQYRELWVAQSAERRARQRNASGNFTRKEWQNLKRAWNYTCLCCGKSEPEIKLSQDHVVPLVLGGSNDIDNIQPLCVSCNSKKSGRYIDYRLIPPKTNVKSG